MSAMDEAVEAAARAITEHHEVPTNMQRASRLVALDAVEAAAPYLQAEALREAAKDLRGLYDALDTGVCHHLADRLDRRADALTAEDTRHR